MVSISMTITDPESHAHPSFVDGVAMPINMADTGRILAIVYIVQVNNTINGERS